MKKRFYQVTGRQMALMCTVAGLIYSLDAKAEIKPEARQLAKAMAEKLASAQTIHLKAKHHIDPALGVGSAIERGPLEITVKRPNQFYAVQEAGEETRELAYDGESICLIHPGLKHHALESLKANSIEAFADRLDERFGFRPPVAELLALDPAGQLLSNVTSASVEGTEWVGLTRCERLHFVQEGMTGDLWVAKKDGLPRRYRLTFTSMSGNPTWDIKLTEWKLNPAVDAALFSKRPAADSVKVKMLKSR